MARQRQPTKQRRSTQPSKSKKAKTKALLDNYGTTYSQELGINIQRETPSQLFQLLCASILFSKRISSDTAVNASKAMKRKGWTTPKKLADSTWAECTKTLNRAGYARYDESTSTMLHETAEMVLDRYSGDLRKLRERAHHNPAEERKLLKQFKGIGDTGVDIFFREAQSVWPELAPFADRRALSTAEQLGLGKDVKDLTKLVNRSQFPQLVSGLTRVRLSKDIDKVQAATKR
jgi:endonuclease III